MLHRLRKLWESSPFPAFLSWWRDELIACLPGAVQHWLNGIEGEVFITWDEKSNTFFCKPQSGVSDQLPVALLLCPQQALLCPVRLPIAAAQDLSSVLTYEMDKYTPFAARDVYFEIQQTTPPADGFLTVEMAVILRDRLERFLSDANAQGYAISRVDIQDNAGQPRKFDLLPNDKRPKSSVGRKQLNRLLMATAVMLVGAAMLLWVHNREYALADMRSQVQALREKATQVQVLQQQLKDTREAGTKLSQRKSHTLTASALLNELTRCISAHTWLEQLEFTLDQQINLSGQSSQPSVLLAEMKNCSHVEQAEFQGAIQTDSSTGKDRFYMAARIHNKNFSDEPSATAP